MEQHVWNFLYFIAIVGALTLMTKYICAVLAARYRMETEKYKYERRMGYHNDGKEIY